jgi:hypothetical protein
MLCYAVYLSLLSKNNNNNDMQSFPYVSTTFPSLSQMVRHLSLSFLSLSHSLSGSLQSGHTCVLSAGRAARDPVRLRARHPRNS